MQRIVVGVDGSAASKAALRWAVNVAGHFQAEVDAVRAWRYPLPVHEWDARPSNYGFLPVVPDHDRTEQVARDELADAVAEALGAEPAVPLRQRVIEGHPTQVLIDAARGAELLVVGKRGRGKLETLVLGSVARACSEHAPCPLAIIAAETSPEQ